MILDFKKLNENISKILDSEKLAILEAKRKCEEIINQNTRITEEVKKELDENHGFSFKVGNFLKQVFIRDYGSGLEFHETLIYEKHTEGVGIEIQFTYNEEGLISFLSLEAGSIISGFAIEVSNKNDFFINAIALYKTNSEDNIYLNRDSNEKSDFYLNSIKRSDLTEIDNKEYEDLFSLMFDYKLNLKEHPSFEIFKKEFEYFLNYIHIESKNKNKSRNKI